MQIRKLISMIPMNNTTKAEKIAPAAPLPQYDITSIVPSDPTVPYDVRDVIKALVDESEFLEVMELFAANIVVGFGRIAGETVGFIANQPLVMAGVLDCDSSDKAARLSASATVSTFRSSRSRTCRAICRASIRSMPA